MLAFVVRVYAQKVCFFVTQYYMYIFVSAVTVFENEGVGECTAGGPESPRGHM